MSLNALSTPDTIGAPGGDDQGRADWNAERARAAMQMRRERRRRQSGMPAPQRVNLTAKTRPGADAAPQRRGAAAPADEI